ILHRSTRWEVDGSLHKLQRSPQAGIRRKRELAAAAKRLLAQLTIEQPVSEAQARIVLRIKPGESRRRYHHRHAVTIGPFLRLHSELARPYGRGILPR